MDRACGLGWPQASTRSLIVMDRACCYWVMLALSGTRWYDCCAVPCVSIGGSYHVS